MPDILDFSSLRANRRHKKEQRQLQDGEKYRREKAQFEAQQNSRNVKPIYEQKPRYSPQSVGYSNDFHSSPQGQVSQALISSLPDQTVPDFQAEQAPTRPPKISVTGHSVPTSASLTTNSSPAPPVQDRRPSNNHSDYFSHILLPKSATSSVSKESRTDAPIQRKELLNRAHPLRNSLGRPAELADTSVESDLPSEASPSKKIIVKTTTNVSYRTDSQNESTEFRSGSLEGTVHNGFQNSQIRSHAANTQSNIALKRSDQQSNYLRITYNDYEDDDICEPNGEHRPATTSTKPAAASVDEEIAATVGNAIKTQEDFRSQLADPSSFRRTSRDVSVSSTRGPSPVHEQKAMSSESEQAAITSEIQMILDGPANASHEAHAKHSGEQSRVPASLHEASNRALKLAEDKNQALQDQLNSCEASRASAEKSLSDIDARLGAVGLDRDSFETHVHTSKQRIDAADVEIRTLQGLQNGHLQQIAQDARQLREAESKLHQFKQDQDQHRRDIDDLKQKLNSAKNEAQYIHDDLTAAHAQAMQERDQSWKRAIARIQQDHSIQLQTVQNELNVTRTQVTTDFHQHLHKVNHLKQTKAAEIEKLTQGHLTEMGKMEQQLKESRENQKREIDRLCYDKDLEISSLKQSHKNAIKLLEGKLASSATQADQSRRELVKTHKESLDKLNNDHAIKLTQKEAELQQARQYTQTQLDSQLDTHEKELERRDQLYKQTTINLREEVEGLRAALLTNDDDLYKGELFTVSGLPTKSDDKIYGQFSTIIQLVDTIGRLKWKQTPLIWTNEKVQKIRGNQTDRSVKRLIVLDFIWCLLYQYIFSSPFRIFHDEGKSLEEQWSNACGKELAPEDEPYDWPSPNTKTERWRYMTVRECREALRPPVPSDLDPRSRLRKGFVQSLEEFVNKAQDSLSNVMDLSNADINVIEKLASKAATMWLEFAAHRFRIVIGLNGPTRILSMEAKVRAQQLELMEAPTLGRYGDATGTDLDTYTTIGDCIGKSVTMSM